MRRRRHREPTTENRAPQTRADSAGLQAFNLSSFEAANPSRRRGWIPRTTLDSSKRLTGGDRKTILSSANWAFDNIGLARRIINGLTSHVGYLTPQACTADKAWNTLAEETFQNRAGFAPIFDRAGKLNFYDWQLANTRARLKDGDLLTVLSETGQNNGTGTAGFAQVIVYESAQIDDGQDPADRSNLRDGVFIDKFGKHISYRIVNHDDRTQWTSIPAEDSIFFASFERPGQVRGISALAHALIHIQDRAEVWGDVKHAIKVAAQVGMYKKREAPTAFPGQHLAQDGTPVDVDLSASIKQNIEKVYGSGFVDSLQRGESWELLHDDRPHPNQREFLEDLVRDIAWGVPDGGVPPEVLWQMAGQTGPNTRFLMADFQRWIGVGQMRLRAICQRFWVYFLAKELVAKRLPFPQGDDQWWKCDWVPQADLTIDRGREGRLELEQLRMGATTHHEVYKRNGGDAMAAFKQQLAFLKEARDLAEKDGFTLEQTMPDFFKSVQQPAATSGDQTLADPP